MCVYINKQINTNIYTYIYIYIYNNKCECRTQRWGGTAGWRLAGCGAEQRSFAAARRQWQRREVWRGAAAAAEAWAAALAPATGDRASLPIRPALTTSDTYYTDYTLLWREAHTDYIRYIAIHPTMPYILSSSDDMTIKLWDWDKNWPSAPKR